MIIKLFTTLVLALLIGTFLSDWLSTIIGPWNLSIASFMLAAILFYVYYREQEKEIYKPYSDTTKSIK